MQKQPSEQFTVIAKVFKVTGDMHECSALSPLLFVMEAISREFRVVLPWELLYSDDSAVDS